MENKTSPKSNTPPTKTATKIKKISDLLEKLYRKEDSFFEKIVKEKKT